MEHFYQNIYGWSHHLEPWYRYVVPTLPYNPSVVEVGCWHGRSTACLTVELINHKQTFNLWAIDHWLGCEEPFYYQNIIKDELERDLPFKTFLENMQPVHDKFKIIRDTSVRAAQQFEDNSLDLIILDDEHSKEGVLNSILAWWPKLKPYGAICGDDHDQHYPGVLNAVRDLFGRETNSYRVYTASGWSNNIDANGVWVIYRQPDFQLHTLSHGLPEDPWSYKLPLAGDQSEPEPDSEPIIEPEPVTEEQIIPTSVLQNPKIRSIV